MAKKIYILTKGDYSEYHIVAATTDKDKAEKLQKLFGADNIEEYDDSCIYDDYIYGGYRDWYVTCVRKPSPVITKVKDETGGTFYDPGSCLNQVSGWRGVYSVSVKAKDEDHARKIAQDLFAEYFYQKSVEELDRDEARQQSYYTNYTDEMMKATSPRFSDNLFGKKRTPPNSEGSTIEFRSLKTE